MEWCRMKRTVLILTRAYDPHVPPVTEAIHDRGADVLCFNLADFPEAVSLRATLDTQQERWAGSIISHSGHIPLDALTSIWWRRPTSYKAPATYSPGERTFLEEEANRGVHRHPGEHGVAADAVGQSSAQSPPGRTQALATGRRPAARLAHTPYSDNQ